MDVLGSPGRSTFDEPAVLQLFYVVTDLLCRLPQRIPDFTHYHARFPFISPVTERDEELALKPLNLKRKWLSGCEEFDNELVVDEDTKRGRLYKLTERGRDAYKYLEENNML